MLTPHRRVTASGCLFVLLATAIPATLDAHILSGNPVGFLSGVEHPISGVDHIIAMVAVGLWGAQIGMPAIWLLPVTFPLIMACGGFLALIGVSLPRSEIAIALSGVCLGAVVLGEIRPPLWMAVLLVGTFGLFHGFAHGSELPPGQSALLYSVGFILATGLLHGAGITIGTVCRWQWGRLAMRAMGGAIMCGGVLFLWNALV